MELVKRGWLRPIVVILGSLTIGLACSQLPLPPGDRPIRPGWDLLVVVWGVLNTVLSIPVVSVAAGWTGAGLTSLTSTPASGCPVVASVTLPLSVPGLAVGCTLVFSLTASSFVTPALLGGNFAKMLGTLVEEQILVVFDWPFGAAIATVLTVLVMVVNLASVWLIERRFPSRAAEGH